MLDDSDEGEDGGEKKERRRKDSGASEQQEEEVIVLQMCSCLVNFYVLKIPSLQIPYDSLCHYPSGWPKEDCKPVLIHRESHTDPCQRQHQHRSPGIVAIAFFLPW